MARPNRPRNGMLIAEARLKIQTTLIINRLQDHVQGKVKMSPTQVRAADILLRKVIPDLAQIDMTMLAKMLSGEELSEQVPIEERKRLALQAIDAAFSRVIAPRTIEADEFSEVAADGE